MKRGRPTKYKKEFNDQAYKLCLLGHTDAEVADFFEINEATINRWKKSHPDFCESLRSGKEIADANVVMSLYERANGYSHEDTHISNYQGEITTTKIIKHYPPDSTALIFWLKNRQRKWSDRQEHEITGKDGGPIETKFNIKFVKTRKDNGHKAD